MSSDHPSSPISRRLRAAGHVVLGSLALGFAAGGALALGLGPIASQSGLGERLRVVVPVLLGPGEELAGECVRLVPSPSARDGIPDIASARIALERSANGPRVVVTTTRVVADPIVRLTLQVGCDSTVRREYTLLMDPVPIDVPVAAPESPPAQPPGARATGPAPTTSVPAMAAAPVSDATAPPPKGRTAPRRGSTAPSASGAAAVPGTAAESTDPRRDRPATRRTQPRPPATTPAPEAPPRLTVSAGAPVPEVKAPDKAGVPGKAAGEKGGPAASTGAGRTAAAAADSTAALEAEAAALQARVVELTALVDKMQTELKSIDARQPTAATPATTGTAPAPATAPPAPGPAAQKSGRDNAQDAVTRWWEENWMLLAGVVAIAALIAVLLLRRRRPAQPARPWSAPPVPGTATPTASTRALDTTGDFAPATAAPADSGGRPARNRPAAAEPAVAAKPTAAPSLGSPSPKPAAAGSPLPNSRATGPGASSPPRPTVKVDVAELSQITEEASVYLAVNRPDRAIDVLLEHIRTRASSLPAAWLMLLGLYHDQGRKQEFLDLAVEFHGRFNAQTPTWDSFRQRPQDDRGLEGFAHLVRQVVMLWGRPECIDFLDKLLYENREGRREGFSLATYEEILVLHQIAEMTIGAQAAARSGAGAAPAGSEPRAA